MKSSKKYTILLILFLSCSHVECISNNEIKKKIISNNVNDIVEGYFIIGECKKTYFVKNIFENINDVRISHHHKFNGISVYKSKMIAIKKISGLMPPHEISNKKDTVVINFYYKWALENNYLSN